MKKILVGMDGSTREARVLEIALQLARSFGAKVVLFRGVSVPVELPPEALSAAPTSVATMLLDIARKSLNEQVKNVPPELFDKVRIELGTPWRTILDAAHSEAADLIVIGSHGYGTLDRILGTTAAKVVNHSDHSVMVVRPDAPAHA